VAKRFRSFFCCFSFALSALTGEDAVGRGNPLLRLRELLFDWLMLRFPLLGLEFGLPLLLGLEPPFRVLIRSLSRWVGHPR
jgi:hypothetical protein